MSVAAAAPPGGRVSSAEGFRSLLRTTRVIAMAGASPDPERPSHGVMRYLQGAGFRVLPVNPRHAGQTLHGEPVHASLADAQAFLGAGTGIDLVNVFRRPAALPALVDEAIAAGIPAVWAQLGVRHEGAAARAEQAGLVLVMDRCISMEHSRPRP